MILIEQFSIEESKNKNLQLYKKKYRYCSVYLIYRLLQLKLIFTVCVGEYVPEEGKGQPGGVEGCREAQQG